MCQCYRLLVRILPPLEHPLKTSPVSQQFQLAAGYDPARHRHYCRYYGREQQLLDSLLQIGPGSKQIKGSGWHSQILGGVWELVIRN